MSDLKPCPFCGASDASIVGSWIVCCGSCQGYTWGETKDEAEAAWNRRVDHEKPACEWDPNGTTPPPVELPDGMRWERDLGGWDVVCGREWKGCVTNNWDRRYYACWKDCRVIADCDTALEACQALAVALNENRR